MSGKSLRLKRLISPQDGRIVILPMDHGVSCGPIYGLQRMEDAMRVAIDGQADAMVLHKGMLRYLERIPARPPGVFLHLSASTQLGPSFHTKVPVGSVEEAIRRGADGVSVHINLGDEREPEMLRDLGAVGAACAEWQVPLLVMTYVRGSYAPSPLPDTAIAHAVRVAAELGADIVKLPAPKDPETLAEITAGTPVPVVIAGGGKSRDVNRFLRKIEAALEAGVAGVAIGRNVFQHPQPLNLLQAIGDMVHRGCSAEQAAASLAAG